MINSDLKGNQFLRLQFGFTFIQNRQTKVRINRSISMSWKMLKTGSDTGSFHPPVIGESKSGYFFRIGTKRSVTDYRIIWIGIHICTRGQVQMYSGFFHIHSHSVSHLFDKVFRIRSYRSQRDGKGILRGFFNSHRQSILPVNAD